MPEGLARVAPEGRLLSSVVLAAGLATANPAWTSILVSGLVATILVVTSGALRRSVSVVLPVALMAGMTVLPLAVTGSPGLAVRISARAIVSSTAAVAILAGLTLTELEGALSALGAPTSLSATVASSLRQLSVLRDEGRRLLLARRLRGPVRGRDGALLLGAWLARTAERAERIELSMALRGRPGTRPPRRARPGVIDVAAVISCALVGVAAHAVGRAW